MLENVPSTNVCVQCSCPWELEDCNMQYLLGKVFNKIAYNQDERQLLFFTEDEVIAMLHFQDCCEDVFLEDVTGDVSDLVGSPILKSEEVEGYTANPLSEYEESYTWTYYKLATANGYVDIRWYGSSNGYYSEGVSLVKVPLSKVKGG